MPNLRANGYEAIGIDPQAPAGAHDQRAEFECASLPEQLEAVVASISLHHVADPAHVIDRITTTLTRGGRLVAVEWASEKVDEETADWSFTRLGSGDGEPLIVVPKRGETRVRGPLPFPLSQCV